MRGADPGPLDVKAAAVTFAVIFAAAAILNAAIPIRAVEISPQFRTITSVLDVAFVILIVWLIIAMSTRLIARTG